MPFNTLLLNFLMPGTRFAESGGRVSVKPESEETVLFFRIDKPEKRDKLNIKGKICDLLVFYCREDTKVLCLVESKGNNVEHAVEQILNTYHSLKRQFRPEHLVHLEWKSYIYSHGSAPKKLKTSKRGKQSKQDDPYELLRKTFHKNFQVSHKTDMSDFLRK